MFLHFAGIQFAIHLRGSPLLMLHTRLEYFFMNQSCFVPRALAPNMFRNPDADLQMFCTPGIGSKNVSYQAIFFKHLNIV